MNRNNRVKPKHQRDRYDEKLPSSFRGVDQSWAVTAFFSVAMWRWSWLGKPSCPAAHMRLVPSASGTGFRQHSKVTVPNNAVTVTRLLLTTSPLRRNRDIRIHDVHSARASPTRFDQNRYRHAFSGPATALCICRLFSISEASCPASRFQPIACRGAALGTRSYWGDCWSKDERHRSRSIVVLFVHLSGFLPPVLWSVPCDTDPVRG